MAPRDRIETLRERIDESDGISAADRQLLAEFSRTLDLLNTEYSDYRHEKLLRHCVIMAEETGPLAPCLEDRDRTEAVLAWINSEYSNEETNRDYRSAIRVFAKRVTEGDETPDSVSWVPTGTSRNYDPSPDPRDMLAWAEVQELIDAAFNPRDAAMFALQFDAGLRGGEFKALTYGDVTDHKHGLQVTVEGKQGKRTVTLIPSVPYVEQWRAAHPTQDRNDPLWCKLHSGGGISDTMFTKAFRQSAARADIDKPVTLTNFRKSSAAFLASRNLNQAHIEDHHGWVRGSKVAARYISVFGEDSDRELARLHGLDVSADEPEEITPLECVRCGKQTPRDKPLCVWCGQAMDPGAARQVDDQEDRVARALAELDPETATNLLDFATKLDNPDAKNVLLDED